MLLQQLGAVSEVDLESNERDRQQKSERVELSESFNFVLPKDFVPSVDDEVNFV